MILYALPPCNGGVGQGQVPRPHAGNGRSMYTSLIARCPVAMCGDGGLQPLSSGIGCPLPSLCGGAVVGQWGLAAPGAEVKMVLFREAKLLAPPAGWPFHNGWEELSVGAGMAFRCLWPAANVSSLRLPAGILGGGGRGQCTPNTLSGWHLQQPGEVSSGQCIDSIFPLLESASDRGDPHDNLSARMGAGTRIWWPQLSKEVQDGVTTALRQERPHALGGRGTAGGPRRGSRP